MDQSEMLSHDIIYEICRWSLPLYRVASYDRAFHEYMRNRVIQLQKDYTEVIAGVYYLCGWKHRVDGPAEVRDGEQMWYLYGWRHRVDGPAKVKNGEQIWYLYGRKHRDSGPAIVSSWREMWYQHGQLHRDGGPAAIGEEREYWYQYGRRCRPKKIARREVK